MKNLLLPLGCLFVGGAAGYGLRGVSGVSDQQSPEAAATKSTKTDGKSADAAKSAAGKEEVASSAGVSLADQMKELLVDFDPRSALKVAKKLSVTEIQSALELVSAMPKSQDRDGLIRSLYAAWAAIDPNAAWKAAMTDPSDRGKGLLLGAVAGELAKTNPKAAIDLAMSLGMGGKRSSVLNNVFSNWSVVDVSAAIVYANAHPDLSVESFNYITGLNRLAETDPLKAANLAISVKDETRRNGLISSLIASWVERDPSAALKWAQTQTNPQLRQDATAAAVGAWAKLDPAAALSFVQAISDGPTRISSFKKAWGDWFRNDPNAAASYLATTKDEKLLDSVSFEFSYYSEGLSDNERAALLARMPEGKSKDDVTQKMTDLQIRRGKYNEALAMLNVMPDSSARDRNVAQLGQAWAKTDIAAATAWLKLQPNSTDRDLALAGYAATLARSDPLAAINWVNTIPDQKLRAGAMKNVAQRWYQSDPVKADAWMNGPARFSESDKKSIRSMPASVGDYLFFTPSVGQRR